MRIFDCVVIDDEELSRDLLENFISKTEQLNLIGKFKNPVEALPHIQEEFGGILFLDIQMPEMTGLELLESIKGNPVVIFTTAYDKYAIEGYHYSAVDYLLKPFGFARFVKAVNKASELLRLKLQSTNKIVESPLPNEANEFMLINADRKLHKIYLKDICYIQSEKEYIVFHTSYEKIMALGSLKKLESELPSKDFIRIHRSYIVAKNLVKSIDHSKVDIGSKTLPIGASYRKYVQENIFKK